MVDASVKMPSLCFHRASGQFFVCLNERTHYLGRSQREAKKEYDKKIAEWLINGRELPVEQDAKDLLTVEDVAAEYLAWAKRRYVKDGAHTGEVSRIECSIRSLNEVCAPLPAKDFGPLKLKAVIQHMLTTPQKERKVPNAKPRKPRARVPIARSEINARVVRIKRLFRWGASEELVPAAVSMGLATVAKLARGEFGARETKKVKPVSEEVFKATLPYMTPMVRGMCELMWYSAARPHEVVVLRPCDVDRSDPEVWTFRPMRSKVDHLLEDDERREIYLGPEAQKALSPLLEKTLPTAFVFDPRAAIAEFHRRRRAERTSKLWASHILHQARKAAARSRQVLAGHYSTHGLTQGIQRAVKRANRKRKKEKLPLLPSWTAGMVRHAAADRIGESAGGEESSLMLGHSSMETTRRLYRSKNRKLAKQVAAELG